jgi:hypothetical protein
MIQPQHHDRANNGYDQAVDVEASNAGCTEEAEQKSANDGSDDSEHYVEPKALTLATNNFTANESSD